MAQKSVFTISFLSWYILLLEFKYFNFEKHSVSIGRIKGYDSPYLIAYRMRNFKVKKGRRTRFSFLGTVLVDNNNGFSPVGTE